MADLPASGQVKRFGHETCQSGKRETKEKDSCGLAFVDINNMEGTMAPKNSSINKKGNLLFELFPGFSGCLSL